MTGQRALAAEEPPGPGWILLAAGRWNEVWLAPDGRTVLKRYAERSRAENEAATLRLLAERRVPAPRLLDVRLGPGPAVVRMSAVAGEPLTADEAVRVAPAVLAPVHEIRGGWYGRVAGGERFSSWGAYLATRISFYLAHVEREPSLSARLTSSSFAALPRLVRSSCGEPRLLHNDLHEAQFVGPPARPTLVDWEHSVFGDPLFDLARLRLRAGLDRLGPPADSPQERLLEAYRRIILLANVALGVGRPPEDPHRRQCLLAEAELSEVPPR
ncbi:phosphotransferase family protein [Micromonospora sp. RP3T]|uniref:phosphotransferase family protein n=1 Tax=Micromonospora sp. RP3T TaxID=2135446 RepID=UPI003D70D583